MSASTLAPVPMTPLVRLLSLIEAGEPARFDNSAPARMLPAPRPGLDHQFSATCSCRHCDDVWTRP